ncbi:hypothetical protein F5148DRAFT_1240453, partial [Russula earlei]
MKGHGVLSSDAWGRWVADLVILRCCGRTSDWSGHPILISEWHSYLHSSVRLMLTSRERRGGPLAEPSRRMSLRQFRYARLNPTLIRIRMRMSMCIGGGLSIEPGLSRPLGLERLDPSLWLRLRYSRARCMYLDWVYRHEIRKGLPAYERFPYSHWRNERKDPCL